MQIGELRTKNFKGVEEVVIHSAGRRVVLIGGRNGQGKSSVLDSILAALGGAKAVPPEPVRRGAENGSVEIDLGDLRVVRTFRGDGKTTLKVTAKDGGKYGQARLDAIFSRLGPDPVAFLNAKPADQVEIAKEALGLDLSSFDQRRAETFEARTDVNRDAKRLEGELAGLAVHENAPAEEESAAGIVAEIQAAGAHNVEGRRLRYHAQEAQDHAAHCQREVEEIEDKIARLQELLVTLRDRHSDAVDDHMAARKAAEEFVAIDTTPLQARLDAIEETNRKARENKKRAEVAENLEAKRSESERLTHVLESIDAERAAAIKAAKFPVDGLEIGNDGLLLEGLPFAQASSAQRLRIAVAMGIAMNPALRVFLVRDGSLLDDESLALFCDMAEELAAQFWIERVGERDEEAIIIEAGAVKTATTV